MPGGRCRSYFDRELGCRVDNGNHLLLSGNREAMAYLQRIGAHDTLTGPGVPLFPFFDVQSGARWALRPNRGRLPWWIFSASRRVPGTRARDYLALAKLRRARPQDTVRDIAPAGALWRNLLEPLAIAALNTPPDQGSAQLLAAVVDGSLGRGGAACIPCFPRAGLSESLIDPAVAWLTRHGAALHCGRRVASLGIADDRVIALGTTEGPIALQPHDLVVLATPAPVAAELLADLQVPTQFEAIVNIHYATAADPGPAGFVGIIGGTAEWVFVKPGHVSVTISAANRLVDQPAEALAAAAWPDVRAALRMPDTLPRWRVVKEKRATFAATPAQQARRPGPRTALHNLVLAGDWTATGLPATIEGAIRSGRHAAATLLRDGHTT